MKRISNKSRIEVWCGDYINNSATRHRQPEDSTDKVNIIQIEPGSKNGDYMVEVEPKEEFAAPTGEYKYTNTDLDEQYNKGKSAGMNYILKKIQEEKNNPNTFLTYDQLNTFANFVKKLIFV